MPVTKTAKRALRSSKKKQKINTKTTSSLSVATRSAIKSGQKKQIQKAISLVDRAAKKKVIHANKASRIKSRLSKLLLGKTKAKK